MHLFPKKMALPCSIFFIFIFLHLLSLISLSFSSTYSAHNNQSQFFSLMQKTLSGSLLSDWHFTDRKSFCNFTGITCDDNQSVIGFDLSGWSLSGTFPPNVCTYLPELRVLRLGRSGVHGTFPQGITNCSHLEELDLSFLYLTGPIPDLSTMMSSLRILDLSYNHFTGEFPISVFRLINLEILNFNEDDNLNLWELPENISGMTKLRSMILTTCMVRGPIPKSIGKMASLVDLELSGNYLTGQIPKEIGLCKNLRQLELYYNQLVGTIPEELGNLTELVELDMSVNQLTGTIPESICRLPKLAVFQLYNNSLTGEIPDAIAESTTLTMLSLYDNSLTGQVPRSLGHLSPLNVLDLSENHLSGPLPTDVCQQGKLQYFLVLDNEFTGQIPESYSNCRSLLRFRVGSNRLTGPVAEGILGLPRVSIIDLGNNDLTGQLPSSFSTARNLSELFMQSNRISGDLPSGISKATSLVKIDLSKNLLTGPIPWEIGNLKKLNLLLLQGNKLNSSIPSSLSSLKSLNVLDLSENLLTGNIPECLSELLPNSINFSNNQLCGPIPPSLIKGGLIESFSGNPRLCVSVTLTNSSDHNFPPCQKTSARKRRNSYWAIAISAAIIFIAGLIFLKRKFDKRKTEQDSVDQMTSSSIFSYDVKSFHRNSFDQREIINAMGEKNQVGKGGSGTVYKIELKSGEIVAVKRLHNRRTKDLTPEDQIGLDKELKTEVETLGSIRHKNIVKLYCYFTNLDFSLLVYEFMPNGNLWDALRSGWVHLDWPIRHQIGLGVAQGLAYLHHDLFPPIIHRDIKSTNILLDVNYQPKVSDFGIAKVLQARAGKDCTTTVIAGTYGYLAPEYAYCSKATTKCDVYSYGVVLMELITGKKPVEPEFGENKNITYWVSSKVDTKEGAMEVLDQRLSGSYWDKIIQALRIAICCTYKNPALRPTMKEVVQLLIEADPCRFHHSHCNNMVTKDNMTKVKNPI